MKKVLKITGKLFLWVFVTFVLLLAGFLVMLYLVSRGPSSQIRNLFVTSVRETSAAGFLADIFLTEQEVAQIVAANVLEQASTMPVKYIERLEKDVAKVNASQKDTVCIDFCSGNDACVLTTMHTVLKRRNISLIGGTCEAKKVSVNGIIYEDAAAYALIKNNNGRVKAYKEKNPVKNKKNFLCGLLKFQKPDVFVRCVVVVVYMPRNNWKAFLYVMGLMPSQPFRKLLYFYWNKAIVNSFIACSTFVLSMNGLRT